MDVDNDYINIIKNAIKNGLEISDIYNNITDKIDVKYNNNTYTVFLLNNTVNPIKYYAIIKDNKILAYVYINEDIYGVSSGDNIIIKLMKDVLASDPINTTFINILVNILKIKTYLIKNQKQLEQIAYNKSKKTNNRILIANNDYSEISISVLSDKESVNYISSIIIFNINTNTNTNTYCIPTFIEYIYNDKTKKYDNKNKPLIREEPEHFMVTSKKHKMLMIDYNNKVKCNNKKKLIIGLIIILISIILLSFTHLKNKSKVKGYHL